MADSPQRRRRLGVLVVLAGIGLLAAAWPSSASAHAAFLDSQPEPGARLSAGPGEIELTFTEALNKDLSRATLRNASTGQEIRIVAFERGRDLVLRPKARLRRAPYEVDWHTVSTLDGHPLEGSFSFGVKTAALGTEHTIETSPLASGGWLRIGARAIFYAALFFFAGGVLNAAVLAPRRRPQRWLVPDRLADGLHSAGLDPDRLGAGLWRRTINAGALALLAALATALIEAANAGGSLTPHSLNAYLLTNDAGLARVGTVLALAVALLTVARFQIAASMALVLAFLTIALGGHANSAEQRSLAVLTDWVHLLAGAIWVGGIAQIAAAWLPRVGKAPLQLRLEVMRSVLARFGFVALPAFAALLVSGVINALIELGRVPELWQSAYGRVLAVKVGFVALIAAASFWHALRLRPRLLGANPHPSERLERRHWRLLGVEPLLGLGAIVAVAALVAFPLPPRQLKESDEAEAAAPCSPSCPLPGATEDQLAVAGQAGPRIAALWVKRSGGSLSGTMRVLNVNSEPVDSDVEIAGAAIESCGDGCWRFGGVPTAPVLRARIAVGDRSETVAVPAAWQAKRSQAAARLLRRAERTMRGLSTVRMDEAVSSGLGFTLRTHYRFVAPDRMAYRGSSGFRTIVIGNRSYQSTAGRPFQVGPFGPGGFRYRSFFVWTIYDRAVRWLGQRSGVVRLALYDPATPVWYQLSIERRSGRVIRERMITSGHFMSRRYFAFNRPLRIGAPQ